MARGRSRNSGTSLSGEINPPAIVFATLHGITLLLYTVKAIAKPTSVFAFLVLFCASEFGNDPFHRKARANLTSTNSPNDRVRDRDGNRRPRCWGWNSLCDGGPLRHWDLCSVVFSVHPRPRSVRHTSSSPMAISELKVRQRCDQRIEYRQEPNYSNHLEQTLCSFDCFYRNCLRHRHLGVLLPSSRDIRHCCHSKSSREGKSIIQGRKASRRGVCSLRGLRERLPLRHSPTSNPGGDPAILGTRLVW